MVVIAIPVLVLGVRHRRPALRRRAHPPARSGRGPGADARPRRALRRAHSTMRPPRACATCAPSPATASRRSTSRTPGASPASRRPGAGSAATGHRSSRSRASARLSGTVASWVRDLEHGPGELVTLVVPELFRHRSLLAIARGRTTLALRLRLQGAQDVVLADVPVMVDATAPHRPRPERVQHERAAAALRAQRRLPPRARLRARARQRQRRRPARRAGLGRRVADAGGVGGACAADPDQGRGVAVPRSRRAAAGGDPRRSRPIRTPSAWS